MNVGMKQQVLFQLNGAGTSFLIKSILQTGYDNFSIFTKSEMVNQTRSRVLNYRGFWKLADKIIGASFYQLIFIDYLCVKRKKSNIWFYIRNIRSSIQELKDLRSVCNHQYQDITIIPLIKPLSSLRLLNARRNVKCK